MKKLIAGILLFASFFIASPTFAYTVQRGDTMAKIAREHHVSLHELAKMNPQIKNPNIIHAGQTVNTPDPKIKEGYPDSDKDLLARLVRAEAEGEPHDGKIAVACVVLNRVDSPAFPDTIRDVIYQQGQFQPVSNGKINRPADDDSTQAVKEALTLKRNLAGDSLFFYNPVTATSRWLDTRATTLTIGHHVFKK